MNDVQKSDRPANLQTGSTPQDPIQKLAHPQHNVVNRIVQTFLESNLSLILILFSVVVGLVALLVTPREEDPQIIVPLADVFVSFPGHSAEEVEQLVATPLEKILYQIDGVEYVYSMSRTDQAIITVRFYVGEDRERSLVKLFKKINENLDIVPPGVAGWVVKPVEIDDVPIVTLTLRPREAGAGADGAGGLDGFLLRRVAEEMVQRLSAVENLSRAYVVGGQSRRVRVELDPDRMRAFGVDALLIQRAIAGANVTASAGTFSREDRVFAVEVGRAFASAAELGELVVAVWEGRPVFLKDVADVIDGPEEAVNYVRHGWGPARGIEAHEGAAGTVIGEEAHAEPMVRRHIRAGGKEAGEVSVPAVTIALAKKKGTNAVTVAREVLKEVRKLQQEIVPDEIEIVITRNYGLTADEKVNELVEALVVAIVIVIALLTLSLGLREALIVAVAVPVVFGLTLAVNLLAGFSINRVTLFALILSLGLLCDDPIVDVENIARHFHLRKKASRRIVLEAVAEIRPPLIAATLAVIVSFLPMFFITGMMGPYMRPMALNVPVAMLMSMVVAFTITPWLSYHVLKGHVHRGEGGKQETGTSGGGAEEKVDDLAAVRQSVLWKIFYPLMAPLLKHRWASWTFLAVMGVLTVLAVGLAATRHVPLKMLPFDNKNELLLVLDLEEGTTLERTDAAVRDFEAYLSGVPEVTDFTSYVGIASPMDFNGMVRHYYLRQSENLAEIRINLAPKKSRAMQSHAIGLRLRDDLTAIARRHGAKLKIVETPPGPPVISTIVAEIYGQAHHSYEELLDVARRVAQRLEQEPGVVDVDDVIEAPQKKLMFVVDKEKAALHGVSVEQIAAVVRTALAGQEVGVIHDPNERQPLRIELRLPRAIRSSLQELAQLHVFSGEGHLVPLAELGRWEESRVDQTIYHKNLRRVAYVFAEAAGRAPAEAVADIVADRQKGSVAPADQARSGAAARPLEERTYLRPGSGIPWAVPEGFKVSFTGEGELKITVDVFRDLGLAFGAALVAIYIILVYQTGSFVVPVIVMLAIPLTVLGVMPGFWLLNALAGAQVGGYMDAVFFTATGMIGMIALAGIVTRDSIILVDFIHLSLARGRSLFDAIMESRVVRLRPILLTAGAAALGAVPITIDPIFSGLAWALIFGLVASTVFTLFVIPVTYWLIYQNKPGHGLPVQSAEE